MCITWNTTLVINDYKIEEYLRLVWEAPGSVNLEYRFEMILFHLDMKFGIMRASLKQIGNIPYSSKFNEGENFSDRRDLSYTWNDSESSNRQTVRRLKILKRRNIQAYIRKKYNWIDLQ